MKPRVIHALTAAVLLLAGCAGDHNRGRRAAGDEGPHLAVPFFPDRRDQWGPAALAGVLSFWGRPATPDSLRKEIHFPKQRGSVALDLKYAARAHGLTAEMSKGTLESLKRELDAGRPPIVYVNTAFRWAPIRSYMVVTGYNDYLHGVYAHFGPNPDFFLSYRQFDADWEKTGRWILLVSQTPASKPVAITLPPAAEAVEAPPPAPVVKRARARPRPRPECVIVMPAGDSEARCPAAVTEAAPETP